LNVLGGHRWGGRRIDHQVLTEIIAIEIGETRRIRTGETDMPVVSEWKPCARRVRSPMI
jgi:hypothetical protein